MVRREGMVSCQNPLLATYNMNGTVFSVHFVVLGCSLVLYIPELFRPCDHVHILPAINHHWQRHKEESKVFVVGPLLDAISDVSVCDYDNSGGLYMAGVPIPQVSVWPAVCVYDIVVSTVCKLLQAKTWWQVTCT